MVKKKQDPSFCPKLVERALGCFVKWSYFKKTKDSNVNKNLPILGKKFSHIIKKNEKYILSEKRREVFFYWRNHSIERSNDMINLKSCKYFKNIKNGQKSMNIFLRLNTLILLRDFYIFYI
jgi:hypothetical protein